MHGDVKLFDLLADAVASSPVTKVICASNPLQSSRQASEAQLSSMPRRALNAIVTGAPSEGSIFVKRKHCSGIKIIGFE